MEEDHVHYVAETTEQSKQPALISNENIQAISDPNQANLESDILSDNEENSESPGIAKSKTSIIPEITPLTKLEEAEDKKETEMNESEIESNFLRHIIKQRSGNFPELKRKYDPTEENQSVIYDIISSNENTNRNKKLLQGSEWVSRNKMNNMLYENRVFYNGVEHKLLSRKKSKFNAHAENINKKRKLDDSDFDLNTLAHAEDILKPISSLKDIVTHSTIKKTFLNDKIFNDLEIQTALMIEKAKLESETLNDYVSVFLGDDPTAYLEDKIKLPEYDHHINFEKNDFKDKIYLDLEDVLRENGKDITSSEDEQENDNEEEEDVEMQDGLDQLNDKIRNANEETVESENKEEEVVNEINKEENIVVGEDKVDSQKNEEKVVGNEPKADSENKEEEGVVSEDKLEVNNESEASKDKELSEVKDENFNAVDQQNDIEEQKLKIGDETTETKPAVEEVGSDNVTIEPVVQEVGNENIETNPAVEDTANENIQIPQNVEIQSTDSNDLHEIIKKNDDLLSSKLQENSTSVTNEQPVVENVTPNKSAILENLEVVSESDKNTVFAEQPVVENIQLVAQLNPTSPDIKIDQNLAESNKNQADITTNNTASSVFNSDDDDEFDPFFGLPEYEKTTLNQRLFNLSEYDPDTTQQIAFSRQLTQILLQRNQEFIKNMIAIRQHFFKIERIRERLVKWGYEYSGIPEEDVEVPNVLTAVKRGLISASTNRTSVSGQDQLGYGDSGDDNDEEE